MAGSKVVGKVSVKVYPDTTEFKDKLRDKLKEFANDEKNKLKLDAEVNDKELRRDAVRKLRDLNNELKSDDNLKVKYRVKIDDTGMYNEVRRARKEFQRLAKDYTSDNPIKLDAALGELDVDLKLDDSTKDRVKRELEHWRDGVSPLDVQVMPEMVNTKRAMVNASLGVLSRPRFAEIVPKLNTGAYAGVLTSLAALSGGRSVVNIGTDLWDAVKDIDKALPKITGLTLGAVNLSAALMSATSNAFSLAGGIAAIAPAALTLPGLFGGMVIGAGAAGLALADFGNELPDVVDRMKGLQDTVSAPFWKKAATPIRDAFNEILDVFDKDLPKTGSALGKWFGDFSTSLEGTLAPQLSNMFDELNKSIKISSRYTDEFVGIIESLGSVGAARLPELANWFGTVSTKFNNFLTSARADGSMDAWIDRGVDNLKLLGSGLVDIGRSFGGIAKAAEAAGGTTLETFAESMDSIADTINGDRFQAAFTRAFKGAHEAIDNLVDGAGKDFKDFSVELSKLLTDVLPQAGDTVGNLLGGVFDALARPKMTSAVRGLFDNLESAINRLTPHLPALSDALASVLDVIGRVADNVSKVLAPAIEHLAPIIESVADSVGPMVDALGSGLGGAVDGVGSILGSVTGGGSDLATTLLAAAGGFAILNKRAKTTSGTMATSNQVAAQSKSRYGAITESLGNAALAVQGYGQRVKAATPQAWSLKTAIASIGTSANRSHPQVKQARAELREFGSAMGITAKRAAIGGTALAGIALASTGVADQLGLSNAVMGAMLGSTLGPWGAAVGGAAGALTMFGASNKEASQAIASFQESIDKGDSLASLSEQYEKLNDNGKEFASQASNFWGYPITSTKNFVEGIFGDSDAEELAKKTEAAKRAFDSLRGSAEQFATAFNMDLTGNADQDIATLQSALAQAEPVMAKLGITQKDLAADSSFVSQVMRESFGALGQEVPTNTQRVIDEIERMNSMSGRVDSVAQAIESIGSAGVTTAAGVSGLKTALDGLLGPQLSAEQGAITYRQTMASLGQQFDNTSKLTDQNKQALIGATNQLSQFLVTQANTKGPAALAAALSNGRQKILDAGAAAGLSRKQVAAYLNQLGLTPKMVKTILKEQGFSDARIKTMRLREAMKGLPKNVRTQIEAAGIPFTRKELQDLARRYKKTPKKVITEIQAKVKAALADMDSTDKKAKGITGKTWQIAMKALTDGANSKIDGAKKKAKDFANGKYQASITAQDNASGTISSVRSNLESVTNRSWTVTLTTRHVTINETRNQSSGGSTAPQNRMMVSPMSTMAVKPLADTTVSTLASSATSALRTSSGAGGGSDLATFARDMLRVAAAADVARASLKKAQKAVLEFSSSTRTSMLRQATSWMKGIDKSSGDISKRLSKRASQLAAKMKQLRKKGNKQQAAHLQGIINSWKAQQKQVNQAISLYRKVNNQLQTAKQALASVQSEMASYKSGLVDSYMNWSSVLEAPMATMSSILNFMDGNIKTLDEFDKGLKYLTKSAKVPQDIIDQLASAGPEALPFVKALQDASPGQVKQLTAQWSKLKNLMSSSANTAGNYIYADELKAAQNNVDALLRKLQNMRPKITAASNKLMGQMARGVKANRKSITGDLQKIINKYNSLVKAANKAAAKAPGSDAYNKTVKATKSVTNKTTNNNYNINVYGVTTGNKESDLFNAANKVKAVIQK